MKKCPFCAEEIQDQAIKCKHCGEFLEPSLNPRLTESKEPWFFRKSFIILAFLGVGPLALPLIWWHPQMPRQWKIGLTVIILILSWVMFRITMQSLHAITDYYKLINEL